VGVEVVMMMMMMMMSVGSRAAREINVDCIWCATNKLRL
jgi:hypothetical protein